MSWGAVTAANQEEMEPVLYALYNLRNNSDFKVVVEWWREQLRKEEVDSREMSNEVQGRWNQGHRQVLAGEIALFDTAETTLIKLQEKR